MMKFGEMSTARKAVVVIGNVLFWGGLLVKFIVPDVPHRELITCAEFAGLAVELLACSGLGKKQINC